MPRGRWFGCQALSGTPPLRRGPGAQLRGLLFLLGGLVERAAYVSLLEPLADAGYPLELIDLSWRCACTPGQQADLFAKIDHAIAARPQSALDTGRPFPCCDAGGEMLAARYVQVRRQRLAGLVLMGTTHPRDFRLTPATPLRTVKINATLDGVAPLTQSQANRHSLPAVRDLILKLFSALDQPNP